MEGISTAFILACFRRMCYTAYEVFVLQKLTEFFIKFKSIILFLVFGVLTTAVNYLVYFPLFYVAGFTAVLSNAVAWLASVLFAFFTNKSCVFASNDWSFQTVLHELAGFFGCRILTGAIETVALFAFVDVLQMNGLVCKLIVSVLVVIFNYIGSRIFVFRQK